MGEYVKAEMNRDTLVLMPRDRIDSQNAAAVEEDINACLAQGGFEHVVMDAEELEYLSSAGLRVILRLCRKYKDLRIVEVSPEVYEIFEMTGFTEMMTIEKRYRRVSVEGCETIGKGSNGEVYRISPDTIVKVYLNNDALPDIHRERELARTAFILGIPTAIPYDVVRVNDSYGSVFELLNASSFTKVLDAEPERTDEIVDLYVELLKKIHATEVQPEDMPDEKAIVLGWVRDVKPYLPEEKWKKLYRLVEEVPENHHMIHGDYHTKNVMMQDGEVLLIDMDTLCYGDPVFEFASVFNAYVGFYAGKPLPKGKTFIGLDYEHGVQVFEKTLRRYFGTEEEEVLNAVKDKAALVGYTRVLRRTLRRCDMNDPEERNAVRFFIQQISDLLERVDTLQL